MIAIPFTLLALIGIAYLMKNFTLIVNEMSKFRLNISMGGRGLVMEFSARWPEVAEMVTGMIVILIIYLFAQNANRAEDHESPNYISGFIFVHSPLVGSNLLGLLGSRSLINQFEF